MYYKRMDNQPLTPPQQSTEPPAAPVTPNSPIEPTTPASPQSKPKKWVLIGVIAAFVLVLFGALGVWLGYSNAKKQYASQVATFETKSKAAYEFIRDLRDRRNHGDEIKSTFDDTLAAAPKNHKFLWLPLGSAETAKRVDDLRTAASGIESSYLNLIAISKYGEELDAIFVPVGGTLTTPNSMRVILAPLREAKSKTEALTVPEGVAEMHTKIVTGLTKVIEDIEQALSAYDSGKADEYTNKILKLSEDAKLIDINANLTELSKIYEEYRKKTDDHYDNLEQLVIK